MSSHLKPIIQGFKAGADLSALQYTLVKFGADKEHVVSCGAGEKALGVLWNNPKSGQDAEVVVEGGAKVKAGGTITLGGSIGSGAAGVLADMTTGWAIGVAMDSGVLNDVVPIIIDRHDLST